MNKKCCKGNGFLWLVALAVVVGLWYRFMPEHQKRFWQNFIRQIPDLPGRYMA